jgi:hypothetical protein
MTDLNDELHYVRVLAIRVVARRFGMNASDTSIGDLLHSGLSLDAALRRLMDERSIFSRFLARLRMNRWFGW